MKKAIVPTHNIIRQNRIGAGILVWNAPLSSVYPKKSAKGTVITIARVVPIRAVAISSPMANAISLPLNHFTIILETVIPAISTPTPKIAYPNAAKVTCILNPKSIAPSGNVVETA